MGEILKAPEHMLHPRDYEAPKTSSEQSKGSSNVVLKLSKEQTFNNASQGTGIAGPAVFGGASDKKETKAPENGIKQSYDEDVDMKTGQNSCWHGGMPYKG